MTRARSFCAIAFLGCFACGANVATPPPATRSGNPFAGATFYVDPIFVRNVRDTANTDAANAALLHKVETISTAVWLDSIVKARAIDPLLDDLAAHPHSIAVLALYDLPNRDCSAKSSSGELSVDARGEERYRTEYIDEIATRIQAHPAAHLALVVEPDSLANIATNLSVPKCAASEGAYKRSIAYAVSKLSTPNVSIYLDAAHAGWLGWDDNRKKIARVFADVLAAAGGREKIRGFAVNVSNYDIVEGVEDPSNPCSNELAYVVKLAASLADVGIRDPHFVVDTSRAGVAHARSQGGDWCNVKGAGLGPRPRANPAPLVDAYLWIKPPGESDGTSTPDSPRFDNNCASPDAMEHAPEAGSWFADYFVTLAKHATPPL